MSEVILSQLAKDLNKIHAKRYPAGLYSYVLYGGSDRYPADIRDPDPRDIPPRKARDHFPITAHGLVGGCWFYFSR